MKELKNYTYIQTDQHPRINRKLEQMFKIKPPDLNLNDSDEPLKSIKILLKWWFRCWWQIWKNRKMFKSGEKIIIHGDTMSTLMGLLVGKLFHMKVAHIESGYRSYSFLHPFPEEIIRRLCCKFSNYLFAPSDWAYNNLKYEKGIKINIKENTINDLLKTFVFYTINKPPYIVVTIHRQETLYNPILLRKCVNTIHKAKKIAPIKFITHPLTEQKLREYGHFGEILQDPKIEVLPIQEYADFITLIFHSLFVISDGGGLQEETHYLNKPLLIMRKKTEKLLGLNQTAFLSGFDQDRIDYFLKRWNTFIRKGEIKSYNLSQRIAEVLNA